MSVLESAKTRKHIGVFNILIHSAATSPLEAIGAAETEMRTATAKTMAALNFMLDECGVEGVDKVGCFFLEI